MKTIKHFLLGVFVAISCALLATNNEANPSFTSTVDWPTFLSRNDMVWTNLPTSWDNAPFVGNGRLGTIFWKKNTGAISFEISRGDLNDHRNLTGGYNTMISKSRLPNGHFELTFGSAIPTGNMRLDLWNAEAKGQITTSAGTCDFRCFTSAINDVIVIEINGTLDPQIAWFPDPAKSTRPHQVPTNYIAYPPQVLKETDGIQVSVQNMPEDAIYNTVGKGIGQYATAWTKIKTGNKTIYYISMGFSYPGATAETEAVELVKQAQVSGLSAIEQSHRDWWHNYYPKSFVSIPNPAYESYYWVQMYKMGSATRQGGPVLDLMGPWFLRTDWPLIWWNLNIQLTYWPYYMSNHLEDTEPLLNMLWNNRANLAKNASPYSSDSYAIGRATSQDCEGSVGGEVGNLPWVMHNLWLYYRSSMDDVLLREKIFPLMKGTFRYLRHIGVEQNGIISYPNTGSPEYTTSVLNSNYTLSCLRWLANTIKVADARLNANDPVVAECNTLLSKLVPYPVDNTGFMIGTGMPYAMSHRHWSHLFMIYPFYEYTWDNPEQAALIEKSLAHWTSMTTAFAGYSWPGAASMCAAGNRGDQALGFLNTYFTKSPLPNTLYREGSPVIETPLQFACAIQELLLTSYSNLIRIFPGVPSSWGDVAFADLRTEGAFLVSAKRSGGITQFIRVESLAGEPCKIKTGLSGTVKSIGNMDAKITDLGNGIVELNLAKGEIIVLYSGNKIPTVEIAPVEYRNLDTNLWGENKPLAFLTKVSSNGAPTNITLSQSTIQEDMEIGSIVGTLSTIDPNTSDVFKYSLAPNGIDNDDFNIVGNQLTTNTRFSFAAKSSYRIKIRTTDQYGAYFEKEFNISSFQLAVKTWDFTSDMEGWGNGGVATPLGCTLTQANGSLVATFTAANPNFGIDPINLVGQNMNYLEVNVKNESPAPRIKFSLWLQEPNGSGGWNLEIIKEYNVYLPTNSAIYQRFVVDLATAYPATTHPTTGVVSPQYTSAWRINRMRLQAIGATPGVVSVDYIRFTSSAVVPNAPTSVVATAGNAQASVAFAAPVNVNQTATQNLANKFDGGSAILNYTVTSNPGGLTTTGASSPLVVTGLTNGTAYTFTVTANNAVGSSVASAASALVTPIDATSISPVLALSENDFQLYPVPVSKGTELSLRFNDFVSKVLEVSLVDLQGRMSQKIDIQGQENIKITTSNLNSGAYFISIKTEENKIFKKFIVI